MTARKSTTNGKRSQILRAATDVFSAREFHTVPVDDVATAAGVGKGTLYLYFPTKEQLFYATILEALDVLLAELESAVRGRTGEDAPSPREFSAMANNCVAPTGDCPTARSSRPSWAYFRSA